MLFARPPLIELIAELRWGAPSMIVPVPAEGLPVGTAIPATTVSARDEEMFMRFGAKAASEGYSRFERIMPPGFPLLPSQPVYRFRKAEPASGTSLFQLGPSIFSANTAPPYRSWEAFHPVVRMGVSMLLDSLDESDKAQPFGAASLRYIDAFRSELTEGDSPLDFLTKKLGFDIGLPHVIESEADPGSPIKPLLKFTIPLAARSVMELTAGEGVVGKDEALIMETTVIAPGPIHMDVDAVMSILDEAHNIIRRVFVEMTQPIAHLMQPTGGGAP
ncbi:MAG: TIGR04255 family protein [Acidobacteriota bacterium]